MMISGQNVSTIRKNNRSSVLEVISQHGAISRKEIAELVNLTPAAVTILTNEMIGENILVNIGTEESQDNNKRSGRKKELIDINYNFKYTVGINIESDEVCLGIANLRGDILISKRFNIDGDIADPVRFIKDIGQLCIRIMWDANVAKENILGVGVGIIGPVNAEAGISESAFGMWDKEVEIKQILESELNVPVLVENNVRALALGEILFGLGKSLADFLFVKYGPGVGSSIIINKCIYKGVNNIAGELGHYIIDSDSPNKCKCGSKGCLEVEVSKERIIDEVKRIFSETKTPYLFKKLNGERNRIDIDDIYISIMNGDEKVLEILECAAGKFARAVANTLRLLDMNKVVLYGKGFERETFFHLFKKNLMKFCNGRNAKDDLVIMSNLKERVRFIGAVALVVDSMFYN